MLESILEKRETLFEIASVLYGDLWVANDAFWGSPTERQLTEIQDDLNNLGYEDEMTEEQIKDAQELARILGIRLGGQ